MNLGLLLRLHLPFSRHSQPDHPTEIDFFRAVTGTYIPLLQTLARLDTERLPGQLTVAISMPLVAMMDDPKLQSRCEDTLRGSLEAYHRKLEQVPNPDSPVHRLYRWHLSRTEAQLDTLLGLPGRNLADALAAWAKAERLELIPVLGSHSILPLVSHPNLRRTHVRAALESFRARFAIHPHGAWLAGCAYSQELGRELVAEGVLYTFLDSSHLRAGQRSPRHSVQVTADGLVVFAVDAAPPLVLDGTPGCASQAPGLFLDVDPQHASTPTATLGVHCQPVVGQPRSLYDPARALERVEQRALHYLNTFHERAGRSGRSFFTLPVDGAIFSNWFEGFWFVEQLFRLIGPVGLSAKTPSQFLAAEQPALLQVTPRGGARSDAGFFSPWLNDRTAWLVALVERAQARLLQVANRHVSDKQPLKQRALAQATRELLLAQSSDWLRLANGSAGPRQAVRHVREHLDALHELLSFVEQPDARHRGLLGRRETAAPVFSTIDARWLLDQVQNGGPKSAVV